MSNDQTTRTNRVRMATQLNYYAGMLLTDTVTNSRKRDLAMHVSGRDKTIASTAVNQIDFLRNSDWKRSDFYVLAAYFIDHYGHVVTQAANIGAEVTQISGNADLGSWVQAKLLWYWETAGHLMLEWVNKPENTLPARREDVDEYMSLGISLTKIRNGNTQWPNTARAAPVGWKAAPRKP
ncbi:hypothetical protein EJ08DRAFT_462551 [Tothia fuscella]|uniref:Uncharacterized protein n=1 Tax=Tothia fuscella TaxID=1048955 RepID=A0A9P4NIX7_9PEZI|nr:hypothetical protein EJ08DRAFT_462551 [Tothia fuscella]